MTVPYAFSAATSAIPLSQLDDNFNTPITLGNTAIQLGNTVTTLNNMSLANVTISSGNVTITNVTVTTANATTVNTTTLIATTANVTTINATDVNVATNVTLNAGTANGVTYLNGSKVLTTGSALTFDGTNLGLSGTNPAFIGNSSSTAFYIDNRTVGKVITFRVSAAAQADTEAVTIASASGGIGAVGIGYTSLTSVGNNGLAVAGNLGIGTSSPGEKLDVAGNVNITLASSVGKIVFRNSSTTSSELHIRPNSGKNGWLSFTEDSVADRWIVGVKNGNGSLFFNTGSVGSNTDRMVLDSSGNLGLGVTPSTWVTVAPALDIAGGASVYGYSNGAFLSSNLYYNGGYKYKAAAGASYYQQASASHYWWISNNTPAANGTATFTQAMTLDSSGNLLVGDTATSAGARLYVKGSGISNVVARFYNPDLTDGNPALYVDKASTTTTTSQMFIGFTVNAQTAGSGQINANGASQAAFGSFSDRRLKENIVDLPPQLDNIMALRPVEFDYIQSEGGGHQVSFIAQEFEEIYPDAVGERADGMKTLTGWGKTEARLVKAIQELKAEFDAYKATHP